MKNVFFLTLAMMTLWFSSCKETLDLPQDAQIHFYLTTTSSPTIDSIELPFLGARVKQSLAGQGTTTRSTSLKRQTCAFQVQENPESINLGSMDIESCTVSAFDLNIDCWANITENGKTRRILVMGVEDAMLSCDYAIATAANLEVTFELDWEASLIEFVDGEETLFPVFSATFSDKN